MFRKLTWIQRVKLQMYEEAWARKHDPYTPIYMHEIVSWYEMLMFKVAMEEAGVLNYQLPVNPPLHPRCTYLFMKPMEQLFLNPTALILMFPRVLIAENDIDISDAIEREERIRMAQEDKPWFQFHADLELISFNGKEGIHNFMENLVMQMEVPYERLSPHPEAIDMDSQNSISYELEQLCATMVPRPFVYKGYVCYNGGTTVPQYIDRCNLWGRRYYRYPGWYVDPRGTTFDNVNRIRFSGGNYSDTNIGPPPGGNGPPPGGNGPPPGGNGPPTGGNGPSSYSNNSELATSVTPRVGTAANPMQANIRPKTGGKDIRKKASDNDDISSVSSESSPDTTPTANISLSTTAPDVLNTDPEENDDDDCSWTTEIAEARAPL